MIFPLVVLPLRRLPALFFHRLSGSKNKLSDIDRLNLPMRSVGTENRAWLPEEKEKARAIAVEMGRTDVVIAIDLIDAVGLRIEEMCRTKLEYLISNIGTEKRSACSPQG